MNWQYQFTVVPFPGRRAQTLLILYYDSTMKTCRKNNRQSSSFQDFSARHVAKENRIPFHSMPPSVRFYESFPAGTLRSIPDQP